MPLVIVLISIVSISLVVALTLRCLRQRAQIKSLIKQTTEQSDACRTYRDNQELMFSINPHPMWTYDRRVRCGFSR